MHCSVFCVLSFSWGSVLLRASASSTSTQPIPEVPPAAICYHNWLAPSPHLPWPQAANRHHHPVLLQQHYVFVCSSVDPLKHLGMTAAAPGEGLAAKRQLQVKVGGTRLVKRTQGSTWSRDAVLITRNGICGTRRAVFPSRAQDLTRDIRAVVACNTPALKRRPHRAIPSYKTQLHTAVGAVVACCTQGCTCGPCRAVCS